MRASAKNAISMWKKILGGDHIIADPHHIKKFCQSVCGISRSVTAILRPGSKDEVIRLVQIANEFNQPIYPISTGKNWGLGSHLPVIDGCAIVELSRLNRIRSFDEIHGIAVIEPGVTQSQLHQYLLRNRLNFIFNVTGSSPDSSIIGNALDRGVGFYGSRAEELSGFEVVLGNGTVINTGFGHYAASKVTHLYKYGVGPSLDGLFMQSNLGVVTAAGFSMIPKPERILSLSCELHSDDKLPEMIDVFRNLWIEGIITTSLHIGNLHRKTSTFTPVINKYLVDSEQIPQEKSRFLAEQIVERELGCSWSVSGALIGNVNHISYAKKRLRKSIGHLGTVRFITPRSASLISSLLRYFRFFPGIKRKYRLLQAMKPLLNLPLGTPTNLPLQSVYWPIHEVPNNDWTEPDLHRAGLLYALPIVPLDSASVEKLLKITKEVFSYFHFVPYVTMNILSGKCLECVINLAFDKLDSHQSTTAKECIREAQERYLSCGFPLYRINIELMDQVINNQDSFWKLVLGIKSTLDPNNIISPGRYNKP